MSARWRMAFTAGAVGAVLLVTACASASQSESETEATALGGAGAGAAAGCGVGTAVSGPVPGCPVGAAVGGVAGLVVGEEVAERKRRYATWQELMDIELEDATAHNRTLTERNTRLRTELDAGRSRPLALFDAGARAVASPAAPGELERARHELAVKRALLEEARAQEGVNAVGLLAYGEAVAAMERHLAEVDELVRRYGSLGGDDRPPGPITRGRAVGPDR